MMIARRLCGLDKKRVIIAETTRIGVNVSVVVSLHDIGPILLLCWRLDFSDGATQRPTGSYLLRSGCRGPSWRCRRSQ